MQWKMQKNVQKNLDYNSSYAKDIEILIDTPKY